MVLVQSDILPQVLENNTAISQNNPPLC